MSKKHIFLLLGLLLILVGLIVSLLFVFLGLYNSSQATPNTDPPGVSGAEMEDYVINNWHFFACNWDEERNTLTAIRMFDLTYEDAQQIGSRVFTGDLAPETYLSQAVTIEADLCSRFPAGDLTVILSFCGTGGKELFRVDSRGGIYTCWS